MEIVDLLYVKQCGFKNFTHLYLKVVEKRPDATIDEVFNLVNRKHLILLDKIVENSKPITLGQIAIESLKEIMSKRLSVDDFKIIEKMQTEGRFNPDRYNKEMQTLTKVYEFISLTNA